MHLEATISRVWKAEAAKLIGALTRIVRDVSLAEELAHDALVVALEQWPRTGVPENPAAWLMTTAKHRALNAVKRAHATEAVHDALGRQLETHLPRETLEAAFEARMDAEVTDDVLRLVFMACHPVLGQEARVALTLRLVGGLTTAEIARAFLTTEPTIAQRIVRAKKTLAAAEVQFELPPTTELGARLGSVLEVIYLVFNEGYAASAGDALLRPQLSDEALRLGQLLLSHAPQVSEVRGLLALMWLQDSRSATRVDARGDPVLLADQDRARWRRESIEAALHCLAQVDEAEPSGPFLLQARIAACHATAPDFASTDWRRIAGLYAQLEALGGSPIVTLNRALALSRSEGPAAGLNILDGLQSHPALARYHLLPSARADLLEQLGRRDEAREAFLHAASLAENARQRERLLARAARLG